MRQKLEIEVSHKVVHEYEEVAEVLSHLGSDDFGLFMNILFERIEHNCGDWGGYQSQLCWIASHSPEKFKDAVIDLYEFYKINDEKATTPESKEEKT